MFLFFHGMGHPLVLFVILAFIVVSFVLAARGLYVLATNTSKRTFVYLGTVFGVFLTIWTIYGLTGSDVPQTICSIMTLPFGYFAWLPFVLLFDRREEFMHPGAFMYLGAVLLNLAAFCGIVEFIERIIAGRRLS